MSRVFLKPYVHKVRGVNNYAFYDILHGKLYLISPEGDAKSIRTWMIQAGLAFETTGCVPVKLKLNISDSYKNVIIRQLQIKLSGSKEDNCIHRNILTDSISEMSQKILLVIIEKFKGISIQDIRIEAGSLDIEKIEMILRQMDCSTFRLYLRKLPDDSLPVLKIRQDMNRRFTEICGQRDIAFSMPEKIGSEALDRRVQLHRFFYSQKYNTCWGHQVGIDTNGEIKPCLWSDVILGNIGSNQVKEMIISGKFDEFWELTKDSVDGCKECEWRYACLDCRILPYPRCQPQCILP